MIYASQNTSFYNSGVSFTGLTIKSNQPRPMLIIQPSVCDMNLLKFVTSRKEMFLQKSKST